MMPAAYSSTIAHATGSAMDDKARSKGATVFGLDRLESLGSDVIKGTLRV